MNKYKTILALVLLVVYDYLFWSQTLGLNAVLFSLIAIPILIATNKFSVAYTNTWITIAGTLVSSVLVFIYDSGAAKVAYVVSFTLLVGFIHQPALRTVYHAVLTALSEVFRFYRNYLEEYEKYKAANKRVNRVFTYLRLSFIPLTVLAVFYWIFKLANPVFADLSSRLWDQVWHYIGEFFTGFSFSRFFFLLGGFAIVSLLIFNRKVSTFVRIEIFKRDAFCRTKVDRIRRLHRQKEFGKLYKSFRNEFRISILTIVMVNVLLLIVNVIDVKWLWFNFDYAKVPNLSQFVHEGTYLLILSILISMGIILYFFRGNLNLIKQNKSLKVLAHIWIFQNAILTVSVAIRNYHYIHQYGLAYKRIGVVLFLILVLFGLFSLVVKIDSLKSSFYLFRMNSWAIYFVMLFNSLVNWDVVIAEHNIRNSDRERIDFGFLLSLSDKTLFILSENREILFASAPDYSGRGVTDPSQLDRRIDDFVAHHSHLDWQSFTLANQNCYNKLINSSYYKNRSHGN